MGSESRALFAPFGLLLPRPQRCDLRKCFQNIVEVGGVEPPSLQPIVGEVSIAVLRNSREYFADDRRVLRRHAVVATVARAARKG